MLKRFAKDRSGATAVEYSLIVGVLSLVIIGGIGTATKALEFLFSNTNSALVQVFEAKD